MHISKGILLGTVVSIFIHGMENVDPQELHKIVEQQTQLIAQQREEINRLRWEAFQWKKAIYITKEALDETTKVTAELVERLYNIEHAKPQQ